ncbi:MAG: hypothetical protein GPOALKHO_000439 [Sodalis sp.]|nr:MAG: hypothetical protein GPOALKHO_000439 [Sodalis sp.]
MQGTGLGLAIAANLAKMMGSSVTRTSPSPPPNYFSYQANRMARNCWQYSGTALAAASSAGG